MILETASANDGKAAEAGVSRTLLEGSLRLGLFDTCPRVETTRRTATS